MAGEIASLATPFAAPGGRIIASPFQFATDDNTFLRIVSANSKTGVILAINGRRVDGNGELQAINESHTPNTDRTTATQDYKLGKGALLNLTIFASAGTPLIGQTYVSARIMQGAGATAILLGTLLGGVVTASQPLGFPGSPIQASTEVEPVVRTIVGTQPALGALIRETAPTGARWEILSILAQLQTAAAGGTRAALLSMEAGGGVGTMGIYFGPAANDQPAGTTYSYSFAPNFPTIARNTFIDISIPQRSILLAADRFAVSGQAAGDQWFAPQYQVREWLEVP